jgi:hypothetical protein
MKAIPLMRGAHKRGSLLSFNPIAAAVLVSGFLSISIFGQVRHSVTLEAGSKPARLYSIAGAVTNSVTGELVAGATMTLLCGDQRQLVQTALTDPEGHFAFDPVPAQKCALFATRRGYMGTYFNEHNQFSSAIVTGEDQDTEHISFHINPGAMIRGSVTDDAGEPVENARILLVRKTTLGGLGERIVKSISGETDDRGRFEYWNLLPGTYFLAVKADPWFARHPRSTGANETNEPAGDERRRLAAALDLAYPVTYYDSSTDERAATPIPIRSGDRIEVNVMLHAAPALHLTVHMPEADPQSPRGYTIPHIRQTVFGEEDFAPASFGMRTTSGLAEFTGIAPGHYSVTHGNPPQTSEIDAAGSQELDLSSALPVTSVDMKVRMADGSQTPKPLTFILVPGDLTHRPISAKMDEKPQIHFDSVAPGMWTVVAASQRLNLAVVSIGSGSRLQADSRFVVKNRSLSLIVTLAQGKTSIEGFAFKDGKGMAGVMVILVPKDPAACLAQFQLDQSDSDGSFLLRAVVPGDYTLVAIENGWDLPWARADATRKYLQDGIPITITGASGPSMHLSIPIKIQPR